MDKDTLIALKQEARKKAIIEIESWETKSDFVSAVYPKNKPIGRVAGIDLKEEKVVLAY